MRLLLWLITIPFVVIAFEIAKNVLCKILYRIAYFVFSIVFKLKDLYDAKG